MNWFLIALIGPVFWALGSHIDKYIVSKYFTGRGIGSLVIFTGLSGLIVSVFIALFNIKDIFLIDPVVAIMIAFSGAIFVSSFIPYLHAIEKEEASWAASLYQLIPVFGYFLGLIFLGEQLSTKQIFASMLVIIGAILISIDLSQENKFKYKPFWLMMLSSFMLALNSLIFKFIAVDGNFWGVAFWEYIGSGLFGAFLFFIPLYKKQFFATVAKNRGAVWAANLLTEILSIIAKLATNFASLLAPLVMVLLVNSAQPLFVFVSGILITLFFPYLGKEKITKESIAQKIVSITIMIVGVVLLSIN